MGRLVRGWIAQVFGPYTAYSELARQAVTIAIVDEVIDHAKAEAAAGV